MPITFQQYNRSGQMKNQENPLTEKKTNSTKIKGWIRILVLPVAPILILFLFFQSCRNEKSPDVSGIKIDLKTRRFEKDFFALDTGNVMGSLKSLNNKYPEFLRDYCEHILGLPPISDTSAQAIKAVKKFLHDYGPVYDSVKAIFPGTEKMESEITRGLQYVKYYFPSYKTPSTVITFIGPMDAYFEGSTAGYGDVITTNALAIGLQLHLGSKFSLYTSEMGQALYPAYISRKFTPSTIAVNSIKNVIDDLFPDQSAEKTLVEQMVEKGKRLYLLGRLMPFAADTLKIGYTDNQLKGCIENEGLILNYFLKNGLLYNNDPSLIKNYIGDSPNTAEFGEGAPGYIGLFTGWQIVKKYMEKNASTSLETLMKTDPKKIFEDSKYRPK